MLRRGRYVKRRTSRSVSSGKDADDGSHGIPGRRGNAPELLVGRRRNRLAERDADGHRDRPSRQTPGFAQELARPLGHYEVPLRAVALRCNPIAQTVILGRANGPSRGSTAKLGARQRTSAHSVASSRHPCRGTRRPRGGCSGRAVGPPKHDRRELLHARALHGDRIRLRVDLDDVVLGLAFTASTAPAACLKRPVRRRSRAAG